MMQKVLWFISGLLLGLTALSMTKASVPSRGQITDDTVLYQNLSELNVRKQVKIDFDSDIHRLSQLEPRYQETLPSLKSIRRFKQPMEKNKKTRD